LKAGKKRFFPTDSFGSENEKEEIETLTNDELIKGLDEE